MEGARQEAEQTSVRLQDILRQVNQSSTVGAKETAEISSRTNRVAKTVETQSAMAASAARAVERMAHLSEQHTERTTTSAQEASQAEEAAQRWAEVIQKTVDDMQHVAVMVTKAAEQMEELGGFTQDIRQTVDEIHTIAKQTNLLALNAQIEAARAGEMGKGFGVVAEEVKRLANNTHEATGRIGDRILNVVTQTEAALEAMRESSERVQEGRENAASADQGLREIVEHTRRVSGLIAEVATTGEALSRENQAVAGDVEEMSRAMAEVSQVTREIAESITNVDRLMAELSGKVQDLKLN
ncbi:hypothetical protein CAI21_03205 [Alkalilimnicola ehrlichii]|uniref:Methyl-accepting transducer domain-containing protein n=1 Tax=Alkalilimnicola ehrlichii TaxID=351052 RepID=A0A3E0X0Z8_9GAMM|nr:methyl-accepting chemotaxis protein [Alkalilimnicola ehrlichii]RFA30996.1 hypothetical protein CAI21_03205 [Alkalilimnicola ehrlichii]RFA38948.1 hypothetical protein CAL65_03350 [Alkalilimnicola ehrlichii]